MLLRFARMSCCLALVTVPRLASAALQSQGKVIDSVAWNLDGKPAPKEYWGPWSPLPAYMVVRYAIGARFSTGTVNVKAPVKLTLSYDDQQAKAGDTLRLRVKAEPTAASGSNKTFDASFVWLCPRGCRSASSASRGCRRCCLGGMRPSTSGAW